MIPRRLSTPFSAAVFSLPFLVLTAISLTAAPRSAPTFPIQPNSPEEERKTIELPDGYSLELVLSEPTIQEPMAIAFDGDGKMYLVEMRTYMQDIDGTNELTPKSRISLHESTRGDGVFDKHSVYLDNLLLPRMVLPLDDRVLVGITDTNDITLHRDKDGDGTGDESSVWYAGGLRGGNMEHQPSGLVWGLDNWIYTTYNAYRLRWAGEGKPVLMEKTAPNGGQWGLSQDDYGKMWWSNAGGEKGLWNYQSPILYAAINVKQQKSELFDTVWPLVGLGDFQGGERRFHSPEDKRLNHFTGCAGQTVYRGDRLPQELYGNVFLPEPVGRLIRRATVDVIDGITTVKNPYEEEMTEFLRSSDPYFRPVNSATGPDGCLYIVDTYRGIIQEGNWVKEGSFLRDAIKPTGMENVVSHGRVWRLVHKDFEPGPQPRMIKETAEQLAVHLAHPNGWWRDTAQRMLIVKNDKSVVPSLLEMAAKEENHLARLHALWTLEGLDAISPELIRDAMKDPHSQIRAGAVRIAESLLKKGEISLIPEIQALRSDSDPTVVLQTLYTAKHFNWPDWKREAQNTVITTTSLGVREIGSQLLAEAPKISGSYTKEERKQLEHGQEIFQSLCFACHGFDGGGMPIAGRDGITLAPPLAGSHTVVRGDDIVRVMLNGLSGPINGKTYEAQMVTMASNDDQWIADVSSYLRNAFGNNGKMVTKDSVSSLRKEIGQRNTPWTVEELSALHPQPLTDRSAWKLTASHNAKELPKAIDGDLETRWDTRAPQAPGMWLQIDLPEAKEIVGLILDQGKSRNDYPRAYRIELSQNGTDWEKPILEGHEESRSTEYIFPRTSLAKSLRITQLGKTKVNYWSVHEMQILAPITKPEKR
ncbi:MAG TPA: discoidin domain-containing protein [Verrucomicrobiales bacterium]|nr:discoidin domain-containing protein [Verrucomicrobiales bacterium]